MINHKTVCRVIAWRQLCCSVPRSKHFTSSTSSLLPNEAVQKNKIKSLTTHYLVATTWALCAHTLTALRYVYVVCQGRARQSVGLDHTPPLTYCLIVEAADSRPPAPARANRKDIG